MNHTTQRYFVFETAAGFCAIAWSDTGITRFQLPSSTAEATETNLRRRVCRCSTGYAARACHGCRRRREALLRRARQIDFGDLQLDLGGQADFFKQIYAAARRVGWGQTTTYGCSREASRRRTRSCSRRRPGHGEESGAVDHSLSSGARGGRQARRLSRRPAAPRRNSECSSSKASASSRLRRRSRR